MGLVPLAEARRHVLDRCAPLAPLEVEARDALGLVASTPVVSTETVPPFDNTAMDGYAVRSDDVTGASHDEPVQLRVVETLAAGRVAGRGVGPGEAIRIMTGAPMPPGADAVVMVESTSSSGGGSLVEVREAVPPARHVRRAGDDVRPGDEVVGAGAELTPARLGVLANVGVDRVVVHPRPRVGVLSTGDELVDDGAPLAPGQIRDSNRAALLAAVADSGFVPFDLGCIPDDRDAITDAVERGVHHCDAVISSGGVSMGDVDLVKVVLDEIGDMRWMQVAIKPAKPFAFGLVGPARVPVFGLPGNPVSSMVSFELFARPALRRMAGHADIDRLQVQAVVDETMPRRRDGKVHFARVRATYGDDGLFHVASAGGQGSHQLRALGDANALAVLPDGDTIVPGTVVAVLLLERR
jgi:molybdopterin molybdotransferase